MSKYALVVKCGVVELASVEGVIRCAPLSDAEAEKIIETEQFLERLMGLRFHINTVRRKYKKKEVPK